MIRVTTNGTMRGYKSSLMRATNTLNAARNKVLTQSNYSSYAEDPAAATQAFKLRRSFSRTHAQLDSTCLLYTSGGGRFRRCAELHYQRPVRKDEN